MAYTFSKLSDIGKFPPPEGSYTGTFTFPGNAPVVGPVEVDDIYFTAPDGRMKLADFKEIILKPMLAKNGTLVLEERSSSAVMIAGVAFAAALVLFLLRKKSA